MSEEENEKQKTKKVIGIIIAIVLGFMFLNGSIEKTFVKYQALFYMKNKYHEDFVMKKFQGKDDIWKTSWGYEIWMYPKKKPDKDYTSDMKIYGKYYNRYGKFHDDYEGIKYDYELWKYYRVLIKRIFTENM